MLTFHTQATSGMYMMSVCCMFVIVTISTLVTMATAGSTVKSSVNINGYVGETIELKCFPATDEFTQKKGTLSWLYLVQEDCSEIVSEVIVAMCEIGALWEYLSYGHQLVGNDDSCENGLTYMIAREPGNFTYKCQYISENDRNENKEIIFKISINISSSISQCFAKYVLLSQNLIFDFVCINLHQRDCLTKDANNNKLFIQHNDIRINSDISLSNRIVARIGLENISFVSQYYCVAENQSSPCVVDDVTLSNPIGITPIVNRVIEGGDAIFQCSFKDGHGRGEKYEWKFSRHIELSRISNTTSSTLEILDVRFQDDGVVVTCVVVFHDTIFYSEAFLTISTLSTELCSVRNSLTIDDANLTTDDATTIPFDLSVISSTDAPPHTLSGLFVIFAVIFICAMCILGVVAANPKTRRRCRRLINNDSNVQDAIGLTRLESDARSFRTPAAPSPTPRRPSATALPLPLTPSLGESSELCSGAMVGAPESSHQHIDHSEAMPSPTSPCQSPPLSALLTSAPNCYHVYHGLDEEHHPLSTSSFGATSMPKCPIKSKSSSTKTHKSEKRSTTQTSPPYEINRSVSLPSKKASQHSCTGSPHISLTRKGSATDQPLPTIPKSPGSYDEQDTVTESRVSMELPAAVIKPMIHGYASIQDDQQVHGDERLSMPDASGFHSPSATTTTNNVREGYTGYTYGNENLRKSFIDGEIESSSRSSSLIPECHTYAVAGNDADENIAGTSMSAQSIYHTIDEEKSSTFLSAGGRPVQPANDATSAKRDSVSSNRHIYEMPVDDIAPEVNNQSDLAETKFYFTLESEKDRNSQDVTIEQSAAFTTQQPGYLSDA